MKPAFQIKEPTVQTSHPPLLVMLHGYGSHEKDLLPLSAHLPGHFRIVSLRAPLTLDFGGYAWYPLHYDAQGQLSANPAEAIQAMEMLHGFINELQSRYRQSRRNTCLLGFSQGAILSYSLSIHHPGLAQYIAGLSGYFWKEICDEPPSPAHKDLHYLATHGTFDEVIPIEAARQIPEFLAAYTTHYRFDEFPTGHFLDDNTVSLLSGWLSRHFPVN